MTTPEMINRDVGIFKKILHTSLLLHPHLFVKNQYMCS